MVLAAYHKSVIPLSNFYIISGCSGSGKSTLLDALQARGETVVLEPGRRVVKEQLQLGADGLPWENPKKFLDLCTAKAIADFKAHQHSKQRVFFDRSLIDIVSGLERLGWKIPDTLDTALKSKRYAPLVFISAPWQALFSSDEERRHSFEDAVAEYDALVPSYKRYGYELSFIPQVSVEERVSFVLSMLDARFPS